MRNEKDDYLQAHIAEYESYKANGLDERAAAVAAVLRDFYGHDVEPKKAPVKDTAVPKDEVETAVEADEPPKRGPGRPRKASSDQ